MASQSPLISVVLPCYKMGQYIGQALKSVGGQSYANWEVIAVDDCGPDDGTVKAVSSFGLLFPGHRIDYIRNAVNSGVSATRNRAIRASRGTYLAFLDPDDWWHPNYLEKQVCALRTAPLIDIFYTGTMMVADDGALLEPWEPPSSFDQKVPEAFFLANYVNPSAAVAKKNCVIAVGGFDEASDIQHVEDWDLWIRLATAGYRFLRSDAPSVFYRQHPGAACADRSLVAQRTLALMVKHGSNPQMMDAIISHRRMLELQLSETQDNYRNLLEAYHRTLDCRIKGFIRKILKHIAP